jgi:hypothetical protein
MNRIALAAVVLTVLGIGAPATAAEPEAEPRDTRGALASPAVSRFIAETDSYLLRSRVDSPTRGSMLPALYVSYAALNIFDAYSTTKGVAGGAVEANPLMRGAAGRPAVFWAVKGGMTAGTIVVAERLWKADRRAAAVAMMIISNGMMAAVAARNSSVLRQIR